MPSKVGSHQNKLCSYECSELVSFSSSATSGHATCDEGVLTAGVKPMSCSKSLCSHQFDEIGFGASMDLIYSAPTVADLLISMAAAAANNPNPKHRQRFFACPNPPSDFVKDPQLWDSKLNPAETMRIDWPILQKVGALLLHCCIRSAYAEPCATSSKHSEPGYTDRLLLAMADHAFALVIKDRWWCTQMENAGCHWAAVSLLQTHHAQSSNMSSTDTSQPDQPSNGRV